MKADDLPIAVPVPVPVPSAPGLNNNNQNYPSYKRVAELDQNQVSQLKSQGYSQGLIDTMASGTQYFPLRIFVIDNSGSMQKADGNRLVATKDNSNVRLVQCTRWQEIQETVNYHAQMAALLNAPTIFRLLNNPGAHVGPQEFGVADKGMDPLVIQRDLEVAKQTMMRDSPAGVTPLARHVREIRDLVITMQDDLNNQGNKVAIILATDGLPTNEYGVGGMSERNDFTQALQSLQGLPVWVVIRLCTDEDDVVDFYNSLDNQLELSIEVLDDLTGEANEVNHYNPWLNYSLPIHRMREMGNHHRLFDLLDERRFTKSELRDFCFLLFGAGQFDGVEDPEVDFDAFLRQLEIIVLKEKKTMEPGKEKNETSD